MRERAKKLSKKIIFAIVCAAIIASILIALAGMQIAFIAAHRNMGWRPDYEKQDIEEVLSKTELTDDDYEFLFRQTGLTKTGIDRMRARGNAGKKRILAIQNDYFTEHEVKDVLYAPLICTDFIEGYVTHAYLENGDILVTSSTHFSGWRMGHAGLVTNAISNEVLQASAYGETSAIGTITDFTERINFMIFSPKADKETKEQVVEYAIQNLVGKKYDATAGVLSSKSKADKTQCAHLVWYAYSQFGIDLDSNGGLVVTPRDLANSPEMELVQVFGFDPDSLWT